MCYMDDFVKWLTQKKINEFVATILVFIVWFAMLFATIGLGIAAFISGVLALMEMNLPWFLLMAFTLAILVSVMIALFLIFDEDFYQEHK